MAEVPENICGKHHTKSGDAKQREGAVIYKRTILPRWVAAHSSVCGFDSGNPDELR